MFTKRLGSIMLALMILLTCIPANRITAYADDPTYSIEIDMNKNNEEYRMLFDDETRPIPINITTDDPNCRIDLIVYSSNSSEPSPTDFTFDENTHYTFDKNSSVLTLFGDKILNTADEEYIDSIWVYAALYDSDDNFQYSDSEYINLCHTELNLDREEDRTIIPGQTGEIQKTYYNSDIFSKDYPESPTHFEYTVQNVEVIDQVPAEPGNEVLTVKKVYRDDDPSSDDFWWEYEGLNQGTASLRVIYLPDLANAVPMTYDIAITVTGDTYETRVFTEYGLTEIGAKGVLGLYAATEHASINPDAADDIFYDWTLTDIYISDGSTPSGDLGDYASVTGDPEDSSHAVLSIADLADEADGFEALLTVRADAYDRNDASGGTQICSSGETQVWIYKSYTNSWVSGHNERLKVGDTEHIQVSTRHYPGTDGNDYDQVTNVTYYWDDYLSSNLRITDSDGNVIAKKQRVSSPDGTTGFDIIRLGEGSDSLTLCTEYTDENGQTQTARNYYSFEPVEYPDYNIDLVSDSDTLYSDGGLDVYVDTSTLPGPEGLLWTLQKIYVQFYPKTGNIISIQDDADYVQITDVPEGKKIHLNGSAIYDCMNDNRVFDPQNMRSTDLIITARLKTEHSGTGSFEKRFQVSEPMIDYDREWDRDMLIGWDERINHQYNVYVENCEFPEGRDLPYQVNEVTVLSQDPAEPGKEVISLKFEEDENDPENCGWRYTAENYGSAVIKVDYTDYYGAEASYTFNVNVTGDVYGVDALTEENKHQALPGTSMGLSASAWHHSDDNEREGDIEDLEYEWEILDGEDYIEIVPDPEASDDPSKKILNIRELTDEELEDESFSRLIRVRVSVYENVDENDPDGLLSGQSEAAGRILRAQNETRIILSKDYMEIRPTVIDPITIGETKTVTAGVYHYSMGSDPEPVDAHIRWYYDENCISITDENGDPVGNNNDEDEYNDSEASSGTDIPFNIKRIGDWDTNIHMEAEWDEDGVPRQEGRDYWFDRIDFGLWIDRESDRLYDDGDLTWYVKTEGIPEGMDHELTVDVGEYNYNTNDWTALYPEGQEYDFNAGTGELILHGSMIAARPSVEQVTVRVKLSVNGTVVREDFADAWLQESWVDYRLPENDNMLIGWRWGIDHFMEGRCRNAEHPDEADFRYEVTDVSVYEECPAETVMKIEKEYHSDDPDDYTWIYEAKGYGEAVIRVTYKNVNGIEETCDFTIWVTGDVYRVHIDTETGSDLTLPGKEVTLIAYPSHESEDWERNGDISNVTFEWNLLEGDEFASLAEVTGDSSKAVLSTFDLNDPEEGLNEDLRIEVIMYDGENDGGEPQEVARNEYRIHLSDTYHEIWPVRLDRIDIGQRGTVTPELRIYEYGAENDYTVIEDVHFRWYYDERCVEITDEDNIPVGNNDDNGNYNDSESSYGKEKSFTVRRLNDWGTNVDLRVDFRDEYGEGEHGMSYRLDDLHYDIWFDPVDYDLYDDWHTTVSPVTDDLGELDHTLEYKAGIWNYYEETGSGEWILPFTQGNEFSVDPETNEITVYGDKAKASVSSAGLDRTDIQICVSVKYNDETISEGWCHLRLTEGCAEHQWSKRTIAEADCEDEGCEEWYCRRCGEERIMSIPAGHALSLISASAPTLEDTGCKEHYKCTKCGKLFSDKDGINEINAEDIIIPRLINIAETSITGIADKTYTGKALTQSLTVKEGNTTLKLNTHYKVSYKNNKNPGKATVTVSGTGLYGGSVSKDFHILFKDVPATHSFRNAVYWAVDEGIGAGYTGSKMGLFGVNDNITRGQVMMFLWRAAGKPDPVKSTQTFKDVPTKHAFYKAIQWAVEEGITGGYTGSKAGYFGPNDNCTRGQIAMFLWRYSGTPAPKKKTQTFKDIPTKHAFYKAIQWASEQKITAGYKDGRFGVNDTCTRGQCVTFLYRMLN